jgi:chorismate mutase
MPHRDPTRERARMRRMRAELTAKRRGSMPILRPAYTASQRAALHALAESDPTPEHYATQRAIILESV